MNTAPCTKCGHHAVRYLPTLGLFNCARCGWLADDVPQSQENQENTNG